MLAGTCHEGLKIISVIGALNTGVLVYFFPVMMGIKKTVFPPSTAFK
jgi:hypothetical protein